MGSVADRIAKKLLSSPESKARDPISGAMALKASLDSKSRPSNRFVGTDPCHEVYVLAHYIGAFMTETISQMPEAQNFTRIIEAAQAKYTPHGPPMSPLTLSYFTTWGMFDVRFGSSQETMGSCILRFLSEFEDEKMYMMVDPIERLQQSRMGFYVHCGREGDGVLLREVGTHETVSCTVPSGYTGHEEEIWFVRVLPPPRGCPRHILFNTPYIVQRWPESAFVDYLERELERMKAQKRPPRTDDWYSHLLKFGPEPNHWNEYIFRAYTGHQQEMISLTGIPDIRKSLSRPRAPR